MHHRRLDPESVPAADAPLTEILAFAQTFDGYAAGVSLTAALQRARARAVFERDGTLPNSVDELRAAMFFAQRERVA